MNTTASFHLMSATLAALLLPSALHAQVPPGRGVAFRPVKSRALLAQRKAMLARSWTNPSVRVDSGDGVMTTIKGTNQPPFTDDHAHFSASKKLVRSKPSATLPTWTTSTYNETFNAQSSSFLSNDYAGNSVRIFPGAIYAYDDFFRGQLYRELGARNPMVMYTGGTNLKGPGSTTVVDPTLANCLKDRLGLAHSYSGSVANLETDFQVVESNNSADLNLQISGGASAYGLSFSDAFQHQSSENTVSLTVDARKPLYTVAVETPDGGFFKDPGVEQTPNLVVVGGVVYGARVLANFNVTFNSVKDANDFKASYNGLAFSANAAFEYVQSHQSTVSTINGYIVGGPSDKTKVAFSKAALEAAINGVLARVNYMNAQPLSYKLYDMAGDLVGTESATDTFQITQAVPSGNPARLKNARVRFDTGGDDKDKNSKLVVYVYPGTNAGNGRTGALMFYEQNGDDKFDDNTTRYVPLQFGPIDTNTLVRDNGGHIHLDLFRDGHDTWIVRNMAIILDFEDGTSQTIQVGGFSTSQGQGALDWYFGPDYKIKRDQ